MFLSLHKVMLDNIGLKRWDIHCQVFRHFLDHQAQSYDFLNPYVELVL